MNCEEVSSGGALRRMNCEEVSSGGPRGAADGRGGPKAEAGGGPGGGRGPRADLIEARSGNNGYTERAGSTASRNMATGS